MGTLLVLFVLMLLILLGVYLSLMGVGLFNIIGDKICKLIEKFEKNMKNEENDKNE